MKDSIFNGQNFKQSSDCPVNMEGELACCMNLYKLDRPAVKALGGKTGMLVTRSGERYADRPFSIAEVGGYLCSM